MDVVQTNDRKTALEYLRRHGPPARFHSGGIIVAVNAELTHGLQYKAVVQKLKVASGRDAVSLELQRLALLESDSKLPAPHPQGLLPRLYQLNQLNPK